MKKYTWKYWFNGMSKPKVLPKNCFMLMDLTKWCKEPLLPERWEVNPRRWKVEAKTCKLIDLGDGYYKHTHKPGTKHTHCAMCGKPVEIVKKGAK